MKHRNSKLHQGEKMWFFSVCSAFIFVFSLYIYFVSASVVHVVMRKEIGQEIAATESRVSQLEAQYIASQHMVSAEIASQNGYVIADDKTFIDKTKTTLVLSGNTDS